MYKESHRILTRKALEILLKPEHGLTESVVLGDPEVQARIADKNAETDDSRDVEFIDVWLDKDNPHRDEWDAIDDVPHYDTFGRGHTGFNHMIDIKKGPGLFDDYDGYGYYKGSASRDGYQKARDRSSRRSRTRWAMPLRISQGRSPVRCWAMRCGPASSLPSRPKQRIGGVTDLLEFVYATHIEDGEFKSRLDDPFDDLMLWYLNDEYVHAPGHSWYKDSCSPALGRYSFPEDQGIYPDTESEMAARFPHVGLVAGKGDGVPYSVFIPVDNLARFWYRSCMTTQHPVSLGPVLHAIQDAAVPHHAAGYMGNWHANYERALNNWLTGEGPTAGTSWRDGDFEEAVCKLVREWNQDAPQPPTRLDRDKDLGTPPAKNWRIDRMVTWVALHGYHQYAETYKHFRLGWSGVDLVSLAELTRKALAMSVLALIEVNEETVLTLYVGSKVSDEFHRTGCRWVGLMNENNKVQPLTLSISQAKGLNGCHHCLRRYDTG